LAPQPISTTQRCIDTAYKTVFVSGIKSDFDLIDSRAPIYSFINKSSANAIKFEWYKGTDVSNANNIFSFNKDAEKDFTSDTGVVLVCLKAYNSDGCWDTTCKPTNRTPRLTIPNVFTPDNNDNVNDAFDIDIAGYTKYQLDIYNRWGTKVFEGSKDGVGNDGTNWNGREYNNGSYCPSGTYFYIFKYKMINELSEKTVNGTITLIRTE
jgi:gliding motility-associated-like protein